MLCYYIFVILLHNSITNICYDIIVVLYHNNYFLWKKLHDIIFYNYTIFKVNNM